MINGKKDFKELPAVVKTATEAAAETAASEVLRLLREIHAAVVTGSKDKSLTIRERVLLAMADGEMRAPYQVWTALKAEGVDCTEGTVGNTMASLVTNGKLARIRQNLYQGVPTDE